MKTIFLSLVGRKWCASTQSCVLLEPFNFLCPHIESGEERQGAVNLRVDMVNTNEIPTSRILQAVTVSIGILSCLLVFLRQELSNLSEISNLDCICRLILKDFGIGSSELFSRNFSNLNFKCSPETEF